MRIVGGRLRGLGLAAVGKGDQKARLRPTSDRVRENLFNLLAGGRFGDPIEGAEVLDVFAGTGALGLEALSRGAKRVGFIENGRAALSLLDANIARARAEEDCRIIRRDACRPGLPDADPAALVFLDPPYGRGLGEKALAALADGGWLTDRALVVWEESAEQSLAGFKRLDTRSYGDTWLTFLRREPAG